MAKKHDINLGDTFGSLTVTNITVGPRGRLIYRCKCSCGGIKETSGYYLISGRNKSCGCGQGRAGHGLSRVNGKKRKLYSVWSAMRDRCNNKNNRHYNRYGGRGLRVCQEWDRYQAFHKWATESGYETGLTIERINNDDGYSPANCRWATRAEQAKNTCAVKMHHLDGENLTLAEISRKVCINKDTLRSRLRKGETIKEAVRTRRGA